MQRFKLLFLLTFMMWGLPAASLAANKTIGILVFDKALTSDVTAPAEVFGIASRKAWFSNYNVKLIGVQAKPTVTTEEGLILTVDHTIQDKLTLDVLVIPSAYDMDHLLNNESLIQFIKHHGNAVSWLASNCSGAFLLGKSGLLDGLRATTWAGGETSLQKAYPNIKVIEDQNIVIDGNRITSNGSLVSYQAALVLLAKMSSPQRAKEVFETLQMERIMLWSEVKAYF